jgi:crotonobetainyl-CoA:carnitine CoA-transferase CaiB-like acyl-CoA transferase
MPQTDRYWPGFCKSVGLEDLEDDPRFDSHQKRCASSAVLIAILDEVFVTRDRHQWGELLDEHGALWAPIQNASEVAPDPQVVANQYLIDVEHPVHGPIKVVASPMQFDDAPFTARAPAPELGQHTEEVLLELGYSWTDISQLKEQKVII